MEMTLRINSEQLNEELFNKIREMFKNKEIEITVNEIDETEYLFRSPSNKKRLLQSARNIEDENNLIPVSLRDIENLA